MNDDEIGCGMAGLIIGIALTSVVIIFGILPYYREQAIKHNAAEWILDKQTGKTSFEWKEIKP